MKGHRRRGGGGLALILLAALAAPAALGITPSDAATLGGAALALLLLGAAAATLLRRRRRAPTGRRPYRPQSRWEDPRVAEARRRVGRDAERLVLRHLAPLTSAGYHVIYGLEHRAFGDIDCLAVGPTGLAIVECKGHRGTVSQPLPGGPLLRDGSPFEKDFFAQVRRQKGHLEGTLFYSHASPWRPFVTTRACLCFARAEIPEGRTLGADGCPVIGPRDLVAFVRAPYPNRRSLEPREVDRLAGRVLSLYGAQNIRGHLAPTRNAAKGSSEKGPWWNRIIGRTA